MTNNETLKQRFKFSHLKQGDYYVEYHKPGIETAQLVSWTHFPEDTLYMLTRAYKGIYRLNITHEDIKDYPQKQCFEDIANTKLQTPLEMITTLWLLNDVSRAFTHQIVRYRVGTAFIQQSMRFLGMQKVFKILVQKTNDNFAEYAEAGNHAIGTYVDLISKGVADQDARGILPTNILTDMYFHCSLRTLQNIIPQRLCCQAQIGQWQLILRNMRTQIAEHMDKRIEVLLQAPYERGEDCGYRASFDRPCTWTKKDANDADNSL